MLYTFIGSAFDNGLGAAGSAALPDQTTQFLLNQSLKADMSVALAEVETETQRSSRWQLNGDRCTAFAKALLLRLADKLQETDQV